MELCEIRACVIAQLQDRNSKEHSFCEVIHYSNKLLESLDYLKKESLNRKLQSNKDESDLSSSPTAEKSSMKNEDINMLLKCCSLQKELADCHKRIADYAQQVVDFRNILDEKDNEFSRQKCMLDSARIELANSRDLCTNYSRQISELKSALQNKADECDTLNITYSSLERKKNDLEIENRNLKSQLSVLLSRKPAQVTRDYDIQKSIQEASEDLVESSQSLKPVQKEILTRAPSVDPALQDNRSPSVDPAFHDNRAPSVDPAFHDNRAPSVDPAFHNNDVPTQVKVSFNAHDSQINALIWISSSHLITGGADRKVKLWDLSHETVTLKKCVRDCNSAIMSVDLDSDANLLLCASCDFASRVWTVSDFTIRHTLTGHSGKVYSAKFLRENNQIISGSSDQTLKLWDFRRRACVQTCSANSQVSDVIGAGSHGVISGHLDKKIKLWDMRTNTETSHILCSGALTSLDLSKNGHFVLASQADHKLTLFDLRKNAKLLSLSSERFEIPFDFTRAKFSGDNLYCSCGSKNGSVFIWHLSSGKLKTELKGHSNSVISCSWSKCGSYLATCDSNKKCIIWTNK